MATVNDAPKTLDMRWFRSITSADDSLMKSCRFAVKINLQGRLVAAAATHTQELLYLCEIADMPGRSFTTIPVRYYGPYEYFPMESVYTDGAASFTFLCRNQSFEREFFDSWQMIVNPPHTFDFNYRDDYKAEIDIYQFSEVGKGAFSSFGSGLSVRQYEPQATYKITLVDAWPMMISSQPMTWADDNFQRVVVTFSYVKWLRKGIDPKPRTDAGGYSYALVRDKATSR